MSNQKKVKDGWKLLYECNLFTNGHGSMKNDKKLQVKFKWSAEKWTLWKRSVKLITKTFKNVRKKSKWMSCYLLVRRIVCVRHIKL